MTESKVFKDAVSTKATILCRKILCRGND